MVVLSGKDAGKQGRVLRVNATKGTAIVERVNFTKKHTKPNPGKNVQGRHPRARVADQRGQAPGHLPELQRGRRVSARTAMKKAKPIRFCRKCKADLTK